MRRQHLKVNVVSSCRRALVLGAVGACTVRLRCRARARPSARRRTSLPPTQSRRRRGRADVARNPPPAELVASFDGLGVGFEGPHGPSTGGNPSDNSLAVGPDHIMQTVNTRLAIFTKKGKKYDTTGTVLYGAVPNNTVFKGFGGTCEAQQQRRHRRPLRPARRSLADRDADLPQGACAPRSAARVEAGPARSTSARPA